MTDKPTALLSGEVRSKGQEAAAQARRTATWAKTMTKVVIAQHNGTAPFWHVINFLGPGKCEPRGIVDLLAVRKNQSDHDLPLKKGDLFEVILIQVKGGSAKLPSKEDKERLRAVSLAYNAKAVLLSEWTKGSKAVFSRLNGEIWERLSKPEDLAEVFGSSSKPSGKFKDGDTQSKKNGPQPLSRTSNLPSSSTTASPGVLAAKKAWATRKAAQTALVKP